MRRRGRGRTNITSAALSTNCTLEKRAHEGRAALIVNDHKRSTARQEEVRVERATYLKALAKIRHALGNVGHSLVSPTFLYSSVPSPLISSSQMGKGPKPPISGKPSKGDYSFYPRPTASPSSTKPRPTASLSSTKPRSWVPWSS